MEINFFGSDPAYHEARRRFVFKGKPPTVESGSLILRDRMEAPASVATDAYGPELQSNWALEQDQRSPAMAKAWTNLLQVAVRRFFTAAQ